MDYTINLRNGHSFQIIDDDYVNGVKISLEFKTAYLYSEQNRLWFELTKNETDNEAIARFAFIFTASSKELLRELMESTGKCFNDVRLQINKTIKAFDGYQY